MTLRKETLSIYLCGTIISFLLSLRLFSDRIYDTILPGDTLFLAELAWRDLAGFDPVIDYPHFYGGVTAEIMAIAFRLFGDDIKSIDYGYCLFFAGISALTAIVSLGRLKLHWCAFLLLICACLVLSPIALEHGFSIHLTHSFVYNHVAYAIMLLATCFVMVKPTHSVWRENLVAIVVGVSLAIVALLKSTFAFYIVFFLIAMLLHSRRVTLIFAIIGMTSAFLLLDPGLNRFFGSAQIALSERVINQAGGFSGRIEYAYRLVFAHTHFVAFMLIALWWVWRTEGNSSKRFLFALLSCQAGIGGSLLTMGGDVHLVLLPSLVVSMFLARDRLLQAGSNKYRFVNIFTLLSAFPIVAISIYGTAISHWSSWSMRYAGLIFEGPASGYIVHYDYLEGRQDVSDSDRISMALSNYQGIGDTGAAPIVFLTLADGLRTLRELDGIEELGIATTAVAIRFSHALRARPVLSMPVWPTSATIEELDFDDVEIVVDPKHEDFPKPLFSEKMFKVLEQRYVICRETDLVTVFARSDVAGKICN